MGRERRKKKIDVFVLCVICLAEFNLFGVENMLLWDDIEFGNVVVQEIY